MLWRMAKTEKVLQLCPSIVLEADLNGEKESELKLIIKRNLNYSVTKGPRKSTFLTVFTTNLPVHLWAWMLLGQMNPATPILPSVLVEESKVRFWQNSSTKQISLFHINGKTDSKFYFCSWENCSLRTSVTWGILRIPNIQLISNKPLRERSLQISL